MNVNVMGELALIFGISLVGEGVAALLPVSFPASVISMILLMVLLLTGAVKERQIQSVSHFLIANMAFFFPSLVGTMEHGAMLKSQVVPLLVIVGLTTPVVYLATSWTVQLMLRLFRRKGEENHG